jgi:hypothetical protein
MENTIPNVTPNGTFKKNSNFKSTLLVAITAIIALVILCAIGYLVF